MAITLSPGGTEQATTRYTLVCTECHAGWEQDKKSGDCPHCGKKAQLRGACAVIDLSGFL